MHSNSLSSCMRAIFLDLPLTLAAWFYFIFAFVFFFAPFYLAAFFFPNRDLIFQKLNRVYMKGFFFVLKALSPRQDWQVDAALGSCRGAVLLCNHLSYLDPLLLLAELKESVTVVKARFFHLPIFGWVLKSAGYLPSSSEGKFAALMLQQMEKVPRLLARGGNIFIFPEGTRSADGRLSPLHPSALKLARRMQAPICVVRIDNTHRLFPRGHFLFTAHKKNCIRVHIVSVINQNDPIYLGPLSDFMAHIQGLLAGTLKNTPLDKAIMPRSTASFV